MKVLLAQDHEHPTAAADPAHEPRDVVAQAELVPVAQDLLARPLGRLAQPVDERAARLAFGRLVAPGVGDEPLGSGHGRLDELERRIGRRRLAAGRGVPARHLARAQAQAVLGVLDDPGQPGQQLLAARPPWAGGEGPLAAVGQRLLDQGAAAGPPLVDADAAPPVEAIDAGDPTDAQITSRTRPPCRNGSGTPCLLPATARATQRQPHPRPRSGTAAGRGRCTRFRRGPAVLEADAAGGHHAEEQLLLRDAVVPRDQDLEQAAGEAPAAPQELAVGAVPRWNTA